MAANQITISKKAIEFNSIFNDVEEVYFSESKEIKSTDLATGIDAIELPVLGDGVTFNTGDPNVTQIKLTTEKIWTSKATKGDSDISFNVPSLAGSINDLFLNGKEVSVSNLTVDSGTAKYAATKGYNLSPKKVTGGLILPSNDKSMMVILTKCELYASLVLADGDNPAYFSVKVTPLENSEGVEILILEKTE